MSPLFKTLINHAEGVFFFFFGGGGGGGGGLVEVHRLL